jgi:hypothetical protein
VDRTGPGTGSAGPAAEAGPAEGGLAETDGNRTRLTELLGHVGFRGRGGHQAP